jgi:hypothetical protein
VIRSTNHPDLDRALRRLRKTLVALEGTDGRQRARKNARTRALGALRQVRVVVDTVYPPIAKTVTRVRLKTAKGRLARLKRQGWRWVHAETAAQFAAAGAPVRRIVDDGYYVPDWAQAIGVDHPAKLRAAKRLPALRRAALAVEALRP